MLGKVVFRLLSFFFVFFGAGKWDTNDGIPFLLHWRDVERIRGRQDSHFVELIEINRKKIK